MLLVETQVGPSKIHGIGLFADQFIPKGTTVWELTPNFDIIIDKSKVDELPETAKKQFLNYAYLSKDLSKYILCADDARFFNHSDKPNTIEIENGDDIAVKDIHPGEELTCDYRVFDKEFTYKMTHDKNRK